MAKSMAMAREELRTWLGDLDLLKSHAENFNANEFVEAREAALAKAKAAAREYSRAVRAIEAEKPVEK